MNDTRIAIYIRLSSADEETGKGKDESNSIVHQRMLIHRYLDHHAELSQYSRTEFVDDGFSGTNTDRPSFQKMIEGIKAGKYNLCITKDFSRFARDYIEMGQYLECLFPFLRVRYISINDGYDSNDYKGTTGGLDVVMRSIVYAAYSRDISLKIMSAKKQIMKKGLRSCGNPPYGYLPDPDKKGRNIIDPETAPVVRRIFEEALKGGSAAEITKMLNEEQVPAPAEIHKMRYPESKKYSRLYGKKFWQTVTIRSILSNFIYTGAAVGGVKRASAPCSKKQVKQERKDWIIVKDMHPAIITEDEYNEVQKRMQDFPVRYTASADRVYTLKGVVFCGCCGRSMYRNTRSGRFYCWAAKKTEEGWKYKSDLIRESRIEADVLNAIRSFNGDAGGKEKNGALPDGFCTVSAAGKKKKTAFAEQRIKKEKFRLYENYCEGRLSKKEYLERKEELDLKAAGMENGDDEVEKMEAPHLETPVPDKDGHEDENVLTSEMVHAFVEKILLFPDGRMEIRWKNGESVELKREE